MFASMILDGLCLLIAASKVMWLPLSKEKTHKRMQICRIMLGLGGRQHFVYGFLGHSLWGRKTLPPPHKFQDNPVKSLCVFFLYVLFAPKQPLLKPFLGS